MSYFKNPQKLLCFGNNIITDSNVENITNYQKSQTIDQILLWFAGKTY